MSDLSIKNEILEKNLERINSWIVSVNSSTNFVFTVSTTMLGVTTALSATAKNWNLATEIITIVSVFFLFAGLVFTSLVIFPQLTSKGKSYIFFNDIAKFKEDSYAEKIYSFSENDYQNNLIYECYLNSIIASKKYKLFRVSMVCLYLGLLPWLISIYLLFQSKR